MLTSGVCKFVYFQPTNFSTLNMLLVIDAGNTDIVFGVYNGSDWVHHWRIPSGKGPSPELWRYRFVSELLEINLVPADIHRTVISSVVPVLTKPLQESFADLSNAAPLILGPEVYPHLQVSVLNPQEIGADLVANAVGAFHRFQSKCVVVDFGTALTFTTIADSGKIIGVAIAPGIKTAIRSLFTDTAQLPEVPLEVPKSALGKDTIHAIQAGVALGYTGMVNHLLDHIIEEIGPECKTIATGGLSFVLTSLHPRFDAIDRMLTMNGLVIVDREMNGV